MKDSQEAIDRVLTGLRDISAPVGMEGRVLAAMEQRAASGARWQWRRWLVGLAAAVVLIAAVMILRPQHTAKDGILPTVTQPLIATVAKNQGRNTEILRPAQNGLVRYRQAKPVRLESKHVAELGGIPAPPMPLTEQERLLLQLAHRADATELTPLNAEARTRRDAEFDAEFQEFFTPPITTANDTNSNEKEKGATQ